MVGKVYISGEVGVDVTLLDVIKQVKAQPQATEFLVKIDSIGGFVDAGDSIYAYLTNLLVPVTTHATKAYSIASKIFMAGSTRIVEQDAMDVILIHLPWLSNLEGNHSQIEYYLKDLKATEDLLVKFYSESLQIDKNTIQSLLTNETYLSAQQAIELGFATATQPKLQAVAKYHNKEEEKEESLMNKTLRQINAMYNKMMGIKNELILQDATGLELVFPDLAEGDMPAVDTKATVDGKPAEGDYLMADGSTVTVVAGVITAITPKLEEEIAEDAVAAEGDETEKDAMIAELKAEIEALKAELAGKDSDESETQDKVVAVLAKALEKSDDLEKKYNALAKQIGSNFDAKSEKENATNIKASAIEKTRAWQILNS